MDDEDDEYDGLETQMHLESLVCFFFLFVFIYILLLTLFYSYALKCGCDREKGPK
jgi:hypothetical protein